MCRSSGKATLLHLIVSRPRGHVGERAAAWDADGRAGRRLKPPARPSAVVGQDETEDHVPILGQRRPAERHVHRWRPGLEVFRRGSKRCPGSAPAGANGSMAAMVQTPGSTSCWSPTVTSTRWTRRTSVRARGQRAARPMAALCKCRLDTVATLSGSECTSRCCSATEPWAGGTCPPPCRPRARGERPDNWQSGQSGTPVTGWCLTLPRAQVPASSAGGAHEPSRHRGPAEYWEETANGEAM